MDKRLGTDDKKRKTDERAKNTSNLLCLGTDCNSPADEKTPETVCKMKHHGGESDQIKDKHGWTCHEMMHSLETDLGPIKKVNKTGVISMISDINER